MRIVALYVIASLWSFSLFGQSIKFNLIDKIDGKAIQFASVIYRENKSISAISDSDGYVSIKYIADDSLIITRVGFDEIRVAAKNLTVNSSVYLHRNISTLQEVILSENSEDNSELIGSARRKNGRLGLVPNLEFGRFFQSANSTASIKSVILHFNPISKSSHFFLMSIYAFDAQKKEPSKKITEQLFKIVTNDGKANKFIVNLDSIVEVPQNFFVAVKYLGSKPEFSQIDIYFTDRWKEPDTYFRLNSSQWVPQKNSVFFKNNSRIQQVFNVLLQIETLK